MMEKYKLTSEGRENVHNDKTIIKIVNIKLDFPIIKKKKKKIKKKKRKENKMPENSNVNVPL